MANFYAKITERISKEMNCIFSSTATLWVVLVNKSITTFNCGSNLVSYLSRDSSHGLISKAAKFIIVNGKS